MKREFLEGLGLEKDTIDKIMAEHSKSTESLKTANETLKTQKTDLMKQIEDRDKLLEDLKKSTGNVEELKRN